MEAGKQLCAEPDNWVRLRNPWVDVCGANHLEWLDVSISVSFQMIINTKLKTRRFMADSSTVSSKGTSLLVSFVIDGTAGVIMVAIFSIIRTRVPHIFCKPRDDAQ